MKKITTKILGYRVIATVNLETRELVKFFVSASRASYETSATLKSIFAKKFDFSYL